MPEDRYGQRTGDLHRRGWCENWDHGTGPHLLNGSCWGVETVAERAVAVYQYRVDCVFWEMVERFDGDGVPGNLC